MEEKIIVRESKKRLDVYVAMELNISRSNVQKLIKSGKVKVNKEVITASKFLVEENMVISVYNEVVKEMNLEPVKMDLDIRYEDDDFLIVNKPSGLVVHPGAGTVDPTLVSGLLYYLKNNISNKDDNIRPGIVHRLDKDTEGLLLIAKNDKVHAILQTMIANKDVKRFYRAIVDNTMEHKKGTIHAPITRDPKYRQKYIVGEKNSKDAITKFETKEVFEKISLVEIELKTGRTHQIRVHFKYIKHPVYNDNVYGKKGDEEFSNYGQFLQAYKLRLNHPITNKEMEVELEQPKEFDIVLKRNK